MLGQMQAAIIFPASRDVWRTPADPPFGWRYDDVRLELGKERTHAWYIPAEAAQGVILFSHGNGGNIADRLEHFALFRRLGYSVFAYDYGGYGQSSGRPSEKRCYEDARAAWRHLTESLAVPPSDIVLYGESLGGGVTCQLATEEKPRAVVLQNTFLSVGHLAREIFPIMPTYLLKHRFDNESKIGTITSPVLIMHSEADTIVPYRHGRRLFELANEPKTFVELTGDHNECVFLSENAYCAGLERFLSARE